MSPRNGKLLPPAGAWRPPPEGWLGFILSLAAVAFAFLDVDLIGVAAGEAESPEKVLPSAINAVVWQILICHIGALVIIMSLVPPTSPPRRRQPEGSRHDPSSARR